MDYTTSQAALIFVIFGAMALVEVAFWLLVWRLWSIARQWYERRNQAGNQ